MDRLAHVIWLGGSPCSGKSTIADRISRRFGHRIYDCDKAWFRHGEMVSAELAPVLHRLARADAEEIWLRCPVEQQVRDAIASYRELFPLILADLAEMPSGTPLIAVGAALMPGLVAETGIPLDRALWMVPTEAFQRHHYGLREWRHDVVVRTSDPERAWENWMRRDAAFAREVARHVTIFSGRLIVVDGSRALDAVEREVLDHFNLG